MEGVVVGAGNGMGVGTRMGTGVGWNVGTVGTVAFVRQSQKRPFGLGVLETEPVTRVGVGVALGVSEAAPAAAAGAAPAAPAGGGAGDRRAGGCGAELRGAGDTSRGLGHGGRRAARLDARRGRGRSFRDAAPFPSERAPKGRGSLELSLDRRRAAGTRRVRLEVRRGVDAVVV